MEYMDAEGLKIGGDRNRIIKLQEAIIRLTGTEFIKDGKPTGVWGAQTGLALTKLGYNGRAYDGAAISESDYNEIVNGDARLLDDNVVLNNANPNQTDAKPGPLTEKYLKDENDSDTSLYDKFPKGDDKEATAKNKAGKPKPHILGLTQPVFWGITATIAVAAIATGIWRYRTGK